MNPGEIYDVPWAAWQKRAALVGGVALVLWVVAAFLWPAHAFRGYWFAWVFWAGVSFGALVLCFMQFLTRGLWSLVVQRPLEAGIATLPVAAVMFLPVLWGMHHVFPWVDAPPPLSSPHKHVYLTVPWFIVRTLLCFVALAPLAWRMRFWSWREELALMEPEPAAKLRSLGAGGLVLYSACMLVASTDWIMSLEPKWYSTMFVVIFGIAQLLTALAASIAFVVLSPERTGYLQLFNTKSLRDLGNLLMAFVIFWTYVSFSQFLIIWSGNLPREISWYLHRSSPGWQMVAGALAILQFAVPFALLLSRTTKQYPHRLAAVAILVFVMNIVHVFWLIVPSFGKTDFGLLLMCLLVFVGLGGVWMATFLAAFKKRAPVPRVASIAGKEAVHA